MNRSPKQRIHLLPTGIPGLDEVLGGGLPEYSFNLVAGGPGTGKTTMVQQIAFARATAEQPALYFTVLGEPPLKMLRHVQQYGFFDPDKFGSAVRFVNLGSETLSQDLGKLTDHIMREVEQAQPALVIVDSFRTIARSNTDSPDLQEFVQRLAVYLTGWQATTFLVGEYDVAESHVNPIFTVADGIFWLTQAVERSSTVRRLHVSKMRACRTMPGLHTFVLSEDGMRVFPRMQPAAALREKGPPPTRASTGVPGLDAMMNGGIPTGECALVVGPSGSGKSLLARHFIVAGAEAGEPGVIVVFEQHPGDYLARTDAFGPRLRDLVERHLVEILYLRPIDLTVDEALAEVRQAVERTNAKRLAIDSLSGFELALAPSFRDDFRESVFRMVMALTGRGVSIVMTANLVESFTELGLSHHVIEFLADVLILQRYVETEGRLEKTLAVVKMRNSSHALDFRGYSIEGPGLVVNGAAPTKPKRR